MTFYELSMTILPHARCFAALSMTFYKLFMTF